MNVTIRWSNKEDMKDVLKLIKELAIFEKEPEAVIINENYLISHGFSTHPSFKCLVAEYNSKIVGMALFYPRFSTWKGQTLHLEDLIVYNNYRNLGIGKKLYNTFLNYAKEIHVERAEWVVLDWNINAVKFYKKSGANVLNDWRTVQMDKETINNYVQNQNL